MNTKKKALEYLARRFSVIPLKPIDKTPLINWTEYQNRVPTSAEIEGWFTKWEDANLGIVTGKISGIAVIDFDSVKALILARRKGLPKSPVVSTGRGFHLYCKYKEGIRNFQKKEGLKEIDLRGDGGYVVAPPSTHNNGKEYTWVLTRTLDNCELGEIPKWIIADNYKEKTPIKDLYSGVPKGGRNNSLARLVGSWAHDGLTYEECLKSAALINLKNNPPLPPSEVKSIVESIYKKHLREKKPLSKQSIGFVEVVDDVEDKKPIIIEPFPKIKFPFKVLPEEFVRLSSVYSKSFNVSMDVVASIMLTLCSTAIGNTHRVSPKDGWISPLFLWLIIIGNSGTGKTPLVKSLMEPIYKLQHSINLFELGEDLPHYYVNDITIEALSNAMSKSPRGILLYQDELSGFVSSFNQYKKKGNDRQKYLDLWNCNPWKIDRADKSRTKCIQSTGLSILGGIQPSILPNAFKENSFDDGLLPRFLFTKLDKEYVVTPHSISKKHEKTWAKLINSLYSLKLEKNEDGSIKPKTLKFSKKALLELVEISNTYDRKKPFLEDRNKVFIPKLTDFLVRLSGILSLLKNSNDRINVTTIKESLLITDYFAGQVMSTLSSCWNTKTTTQNNISRIVGAIFSLKDIFKNNKLRLSILTDHINKNKVKTEKLSPEKIGQIIKGLGMNTKKIGGYSQLVWNENKMNELFNKYNLA